MKPIIILILIILLGLALRIYRLDNRPLGFTWDEAAIGYNASSLLHSGRDEHGQLFPVIFKSFGDFKPGLFIYLTVPAVAVLGLTEFATRLPSAISGTLLILLVYLLTRYLFPAKNYALFTSLAIAISPWAIHFSRGAWEANFALLLTTLALILYLRRSYYLASLFFGLTFWSYQGAKLFTPLLILSLLVIYRPQIKPKSIIITLGMLLLLLTPVIINFSAQSGRLKVFSVFSYTRSSETVAGILKQDQASSPNLLYYLYHSEKLDQFRGIVTRYLNYFSPRFLFIEGNWSDLRQQAAPFYGNLHLPEIITLLLGLITLLKSKSRSGLLILVWLLVAPLPAAFSRDIISSVRSLPLVIPLSLISGIGVSGLFKHRILRIIWLPLIISFLVYFLDLYFVHSPQYTAVDWLYPYQPVMQIIKAQQYNYSRIVFTEKLGQPYIFTLFHLYPNSKITPELIIREDNPQGDVGRVTDMGKFSYRPIYWPSDRGLTSTLFVGDQYELPVQDLSSTPNLIHLGTVNYPNGSPGLTIVGLQ